ncbi:hypothetical protein OH807_11920 [Kitasatospora sp. NBC_01560]|uniref:hypothetical protein n=1 Tax=Kitasatospora sp. NBC_01560 TaxID=2975965 RepID=UPI003870039F
MTASAPISPRPGRAVLAGRPVGVLWVLLLVGLLTALPCAGQARAVTADRAVQPTAAPPTTPVGPAVAEALGASTAFGPSTASKASTASMVSKASKASGAPAAAHPARHADDPRHRTWCSVDGEPPLHNNGCSGHPSCGQDAQLPNPPPQPQPAPTACPEIPEALPRVVPHGLLDGSHPTPDLHELQVHRS